MRTRSTLGWSQSKIFLVILLFWAYYQASARF